MAERRASQPELKEDLEFLRSRYKEGLEEMRRNSQAEVVITVREVERTYESLLQEQLLAIRAGFDERLARYRKEIDEAYVRNRL